MSPITKIAVPMLAAAGLASAQCSARNGNTIIQNSGDAAAFANCPTYTGNIEISEDAAGPIAIDGVGRIDGDLILRNNDAIQQLSANNLTEITGNFTLSEALALNTVNFPKLTAVGSLDWITLPALQRLGFDGEISQATEVRIENTELQTLEGLNLEEVETLILVNNRYINEVQMEGLVSVGTELTLQGNNEAVSVSFPNLTWATTLVFRSVANVSLPSLETINSSLIFSDNSFESFEAPNLVEVGGALSFAANEQLTNVSFPVLESVKDNLELANNTQLHIINGFPELTTIEGALDINGNVTQLEIPKLERVDGAFNMQSTGDVQSACTDFFDPLQERGGIEGEYVCEGSLESAGGEGSEVASKQDGSEGREPESAASSLTISASLSLLAALVFFL